MGATEDFVTKCRRKLVDTSMRGRLLNYSRGAKTGSVEIVGEHPAAVWDSIVVAKRTMVFRGRPDDGDEGAEVPGELFESPAEATGGSDGDERDAETDDAFAAAIEGATAERHRDGFLETRVAASALPTKLLRLSDTARLTLEEQGVATLFLALGFLRFFEADASETERRAPLLLVPVLLEREGKDRWRVRLREDEPIVNPALVEYLREHRLTLPELPESLEGFSPLAWYRQVQQAVAGKPRWRVSADCTVGIFSFQKFVMHEDLKRNVASLARHDVIERLATRSGGGSGRSELPADVKSLDLDRERPIEKAPLVVDADSSQLRALAAVAGGHHMVIEGPPGTGKSQTIANVIAGALSSGKTVLFVAEKRAALNVVYDRLKKCGLGDFCFEVHSSKANKKDVLKELGRCLDATLARVPAAEFDVERLARIRDELTQYAQAVHEVVKPLGKSVYAVIGRLAALSGAPDVRVPLVTSVVSGEGLTRTLELLDRVSAAATRVGDPQLHPWRDAGKESIGLDSREAVEASLADLGVLSSQLEAAVSHAAAEFGMPSDPTPQAGLDVSELADLLDRCPGVQQSIAADDSWDTVGAKEAAALVERGRRLLAEQRRISSILREETPLADLASAAAIVDLHASSRIAWVRPSWRRARGTLRGATRQAQWRGAAHAATTVRAAEQAATARQSLASDAVAVRRFGQRWRGAESDWDELASVASWVSEFRVLRERRGFSPAVFTAVEKPRPLTAALRRVVALFEKFLAAWRSLGGAVGWPVGYWEDRRVSEIFERAREVCAAPAGWREWIELRSLCAEVATSTAAPLLHEAQAHRIHWRDLARAFERRFLERWLDARTEGSPVLRRFLGDSHAAKVAEFRALDRKILEHHRRTLAAELRSRAQKRLQDRALAEDVRFLRDQLARQRGHKPLRELLKRACGAIQALKPCFLMSPMTVAQGLDPAKHRFDLVVFDEASQMTPEDALGAILRGTQVVVVGDPKQLPPTNFFAVQSGQVQANGTEAEPEFDDLDSVLELALASGFAGTRLRWHYRSRHESLIAYSNQRFYDSELYTFPGADLDRRVRGLRFEYLPDGRYEGQGVNRVEAKRVVDEVVAHARAHPTVSLGVGTFSLAQQLAVQDELESRRRDEPWLEDFLSLEQPEPFFVKNLESIQGDERDVIILSITYGPGTDGKIRHHFGPINGQNGWRRLNVLTTRARERMLVISSMHADDIDLTRAHSSGAELLRAFLRYAESDLLDGNPVVDATSGAESPLEAEVAAALVRAGVRVQPQVGVAGYRIDLGILDPEVSGRFVCGVECDGVTYHAAESARDRDRLREEVLRGLGWTLHRVWSLDWWHDRKGQTDRLLRLIGTSRDEARRTTAIAIRGSNIDRPPPAGLAVPLESAGREGEGASATRSVQSLQFAAYVKANPPLPRSTLLNASADEVGEVMYMVVSNEGPLHEEDLRARTLSAFGQSREGSRMASALDAGLRALRSSKLAETDRESWRATGSDRAPRTRDGTGVPADRIPSWEYDAAVIAILTQNEPLAEDDLVAAARDAFGYGAASDSLRTRVLAAVSRLTKAARVGIGSGGLRLISDAKTQ